MSCKQDKKAKNNSSKTTTTIILQAFEDIDSSYSNFIFNELNKYYPSIKINSSTSFPARTLNKNKTRYRADSLIAFLSKQAKPNEVLIGLTNKDISTAKDTNDDWGVMGLGYQPGNACIASTFRLSKTNTKEQLFKVAIHELGHTQGLPHCPNKLCF